MPLSTSDVLDAYRADLSNAGKSEFTDADGTWLAFGTLLQRAVSLPNDDRVAYLRSAAEAMTAARGSASMGRAIAALASDATSPDALCAVVSLLATDAEDAGAFALATAMLDFARSLVGLGEFRLQGRLLAHQGRILRKLGEAELARELFETVGEIGETHGDRELTARALLGKAILAQQRGNYPEARAQYESVLDVPESAEAVREIHVHAHHGLLVVSAIAQDFDRAVKHGALAVAGATTEPHRLEMLQNLASVCYDVGQYRSALHGYLQVLAASPLLRVAIGCFGGAAISAGRLGEAATVHELAAAARLVLRQRGHEFELADMSREFAEGYAYLGDVERSAAFRDEALDRARRGRYFEIVHRLESMQAPVRREELRPIVLTGDALAIAAHLASGDSDELLAAAVSSGHSEWNSR